MTRVLLETVRQYREQARVQSEKEVVFPSRRPGRVLGQDIQRRQVRRVVAMPGPKFIGVLKEVNVDLLLQYTNRLD